jgi:hypothetical protein
MDHAAVGPINTDYADLGRVVLGGPGSHPAQGQAAVTPGLEERETPASIATWKYRREAADGYSRSAVGAATGSSAGPASRVPADVAAAVVTGSCR